MSDRHVSFNEAEARRASDDGRGANGGPRLLHRSRDLVEPSLPFVALPVIVRGSIDSTRPWTALAPSAAGGQVDATARVLAEQMRKTLGQPIIIGNVSGADGTIGTGRVARAVPDGYTIDLGT